MEFVLDWSGGMAAMVQQFRIDYYDTKLETFVSYNKGENVAGVWNFYESSHTVMLDTPITTSRIRIYLLKSVSLSNNVNLALHGAIRVGAFGCNASPVPGK